MRCVKHGLIAALLVLTATSALIFIPGLPVNQANFKHLQAATDLLEKDLDGTITPNQQYSNARRNNATTQRYATLANYFLQLLANDPGIAQFNNIIAGHNNNLIGSKNIIIGANNNIMGSHNYIFSQNYNSNQTPQAESSDIFVFDTWLMQIMKINQISAGANKAIISIS